MNDDALQIRTATQTPRPCLSLIVAKSRNNIIGRDGDLPWKLSSDLQFFKATTLGKPCLMGRVTWESLPFPLPGRANLVLTRDQSYNAKGAEVFHDMYDMVGRGFEIAARTGQSEIMLIGGAQLYARLVPHCDKLYISDVDAVIDGDAHFPLISAFDWTLSAERVVPRSDKDDYSFTIREYTRKKPH